MLRSVEHRRLPTVSSRRHEAERHVRTSWFETRRRSGCAPHRERPEWALPLDPRRTDQARSFNRDAGIADDFAPFVAVAPDALGEVLGRAHDRIDEARREHLIGELRV